MKEHKAEAKAMHAKKLASYGGKSRGTDFSDKGKFAGSAPPVGTETQRADEIKPGLGSLVRTVKKGGAVEGDKPMKRLDRKPRKCGGRVKKEEGGRAGWEGSKKDVAEDKKLAKKHGMSLKDWEKSEMDEEHDEGESEEMKKGGRAKRAEGGRVGKGKTNITIHIAPPQQAAPPMPMPMPGPGAGAAPPPPPPPGPPMGMMPPGGPPPMGAPAGPPPNLAALMGRKAGGRVNKDIEVKKPRKSADGTIGLDGGALGGVARRQKIELQK